MAATIGTTIKRLRREQDMTQEQLAEYLNISPQAISQWERDVSAPDLSLIVPIANLFGVTIDELFDRDTAAEERDTTEYAARQHELLHDGRVIEAITLAREGLSKYPRSFRLMKLFMNAVLSGGHDSEEEYQRNCTDAVRMGERILEDCTDSEIRSAALSYLVELHSFCDPVRDAEKAIKYAETAPSYHCGRELLLANAYPYKKDDDRKFTQLQNNIISFMNEISECLELNNYVSYEDALFGYETAIKLWHTLIYDGNFLWYHCRLRILHIAAAEAAAKLGKRERTIEHLRYAMDHAIAYDALPQELHRRAYSVRIKCGQRGNESVHRDRNGDRETHYERKRHFRLSPRGSGVHRTAGSVKSQNIILLSQSSLLLEKSQQTRTGVFYRIMLYYNRR